MRKVTTALLLAVSALAQVPGAPADTPATPAAPADVRATPRSAVLGFLEAARQRDYRRAASFLQLRNGMNGPELAERFKQVLDAR